MRSFLAPLTAALLAAPLAAQQKHPITFDDFAAVRAVGDPQLSPDGKVVLYSVRTTDVSKNTRASHTVSVPIGGGAAQAFPANAADVAATEARWSPDGKYVAFIAGGQLWIAEPSGAGRKQLTHLNGGATGPVWSPTSDRIAFTSAVYPECSNDACNAAKEKAAADNKVKAHIADQLMFRHWNAWDEGTRSHLFVVGIDGSAPRDLISGAKYDVPPGPFGGSEGYGWSPDGRELAYTAKDQGRADATSTDVNVYTISASGGAPIVITAANKGADQNPVYSPDGRYIAYASQKRAGFESDRWRLMVYNRTDKTSKELLPTWDRNADAYLWSPDMSGILVQTTDAGRDKLFRAVFARGGNGLGVSGVPQIVVGDHNNTAFSISRDGRSVVWLRDATEFPAEVYVADLMAAGAANVRALTHENDALVASLAVNPAEDFWFTGAAGLKVQGFIVKPPNWQPGKKYPAILLIHGGPQGAWLDQWHGRWNYQMFATTGAALVIINPRGSFGYGQQFVDDVSRGWGGKVYTDLMAGLDAAIAKNPWIDANALGAAGGSFGGYMVNWIAGHTNRFKALVSHAGPFNLENMATATEELWFPDWEYGGPFWDPKAMASEYRVYSPHLFVKNFKTPTLVTGGELDYRVPYTEDLSMFTSLQRMNVPSRLVIFPDEGHWIGKPQNQRLWWGEVQGWMKKYLEGGPKA
ncbi:MAG TPA: S9 family peptidase [Gemmatimonadaceae bacterium]|jgi:dipeptidyl aminopeptidase/acylaminoacyl peptidase|nr:S9 family peptidase [Gemmatimonadaceae bacterium]